MRWVPRLLDAEIRSAIPDFPAIVLTGPRRAGKTSLLRRLVPRATYRLLEDPETLARVRADPRGFLAELAPPVILDEIQNAPELLGWIRADVDGRRSRRARWFLTGSQEAPLMQGVSESMAGRAAAFHLLPLAVAESPKVTVLRGGYPEVVARPRTSATWFRSYVQTYLERDVRSVTAIRDLGTFRRFLGLLATRTGQFLNRSDLAAPLGVSVPTISQWVGVLETTGVVLLVPPYFENFGKRLVKSPRVYFVDPGLACHLLAIDSVAALTRSPFHGPVFEGFVAAEIAKLQAANGRARELYCFRDQQGLEVDFVIPTGPGRLALIEAKASSTLRPEMGAPLVRLASAVSGYETRSVIVHPRGTRTDAPRTVRPGVTSADVSELEDLLRPAR